MTSKVSINYSKGDISLHDLENLIVMYYGSEDKIVATFSPIYIENTHNLIRVQIISGILDNYKVDLPNEVLNLDMDKNIVSFLMHLQVENYSIIWEAKNKNINIELYPDSKITRYEG